MPNADPTSCNTRIRNWYSFTSDNYLLRRNKIDQAPDTIAATYPYSFFELDTETDTLYSHRDSSGLAIEASIREYDIGSESDSTNLVLVAYGNIFFGAGYVYKIGDANGLIGARVGGLTYGDTTLISSYVLYQENSLPKSTQSKITVFPNPTQEGINAIIESEEVGPYTISIFNLLGQEIWSEKNFGKKNSKLTFQWPGENALAAGLYFLVFRNERGYSASQSFYLIR